MATDIERLAVLIEANTKSYENAMKKLQSSTDKAIRASQKSIDSLDAKMRSLQSTVTRVAGIFGVAFSARALVNFIKSNVEAGEATGDLAERLGITAESLQELTYAAQLNGSSQEGLATAFKGMSNFLGEVERHSKAAEAELRNLGLTAADLRGKAPEQVFEILLDRIGKIEDPLRRNAELVKIFSKAGLEMAQMAMQGANGIDALRQKARDLGLVLSNDTIKHLQEAGDKIDTIKTASATAGAKMTEAFLPAIDALEKLVTDPGFQKGMADLAGNIGAIVKFLVEHPELVRILGGAAVGARVGGLPGAIVGAAGASIYGAAAGTKTTVARKNPDGSLARNPDGSVIWDDPGAGSPTIPEVTVFGGNRGKGTGSGNGAGFVAPEVDAMKKKYEELTFALQQQLQQLTLNDREQAISNELTKLGKDASEAQKGAIAALTGKLYDQKLAIEANRQAAQFFAETAYEGFSQLIPQIQTGNTALDSMINKLIEAAARALLLGDGPLAGLFGTASGTQGVAGGLLGALFGGFRAQGGPVSSGKAYGIGEKGPEIFVPKTAGTVIPNQGMAAGGTTHIVLEVAAGEMFDARVLSVSGPQSQKISVTAVSVAQKQVRRAQQLGG